MNPPTPDNQNDDGCDHAQRGIDHDWTGVWIVFAMMFLTLFLAFGV